MKTILLSTVLAALVIVGCGKTETKPNPISTSKLNGVEYVPLDKAALAMNDGGVGGTGSLVFRTPRPKDNNYQLTFLLKPGGSVTLVTNADNALKGGANLKFSRTNDNKLSVTLSAGAKSFDLSADFTTYNAGSDVTLQFDVHEHGHVIHFEKGAEKNEYAMDKVAGTFWGLMLDQALVTNAVAGSPLKPE